MSIIWIFEISH